MNRSSSKVLPRTGAILYSSTETNLVPGTKDLKPFRREHVADFELHTISSRKIIRVLDRWQRIIDDMIAEARKR